MYAKAVLDFSDYCRGNVFYFPHPGTGIKRCGISGASLQDMSWWAPGTIVLLRGLKTLLPECPSNQSRK
jgi:hypothetical protein